MVTRLSQTSLPDRICQINLEGSPEQRGFENAARERIQTNIVAISCLEFSLSKIVRKSYFFTEGSQEAERCRKIFQEFSQHFKGAEKLVPLACHELHYTEAQISEIIARQCTKQNHFSRYTTPIVREITKAFKASQRTTHLLKVIETIPSELLSAEIQEILEWVPELLLDFLKQESKKIREDTSLSTREYDLYSTWDWFWYGVSRELTPTMADTLKRIYPKLLALHWLKTDLEYLENFLRAKQLEEASIDPRRFSFEIDGCQYILKFTVGGGSCALHALLGEEINGEYRFPGDRDTSSALVKKHFTDTLTENLSHQPLLKDILRDTLINYLNEALNPDSPDYCAHMLFSESFKGRSFKKRWISLTKDFQVRAQIFKEQEASLWVPHLNSGKLTQRIMVEIREQKAGQQFYQKNEQEVLVILREKPLLLVDIVNTKPGGFLKIVHDPTIVAIRETQRTLQLERGYAQQQFVLSEEVCSHYVQTFHHPRFFLNTNEIKLAAYLFNKKALLVTSRPEGVVPIEHINPEVEGEFIVICHFGEHFSRCVLINPLSVRDGAFAYVLKALEDEKHRRQLDKEERLARHWERNAFVERLLSETWKEQGLQFSTSLGVSLATANPVFVGTQSIRSIFALAEARFYPGEENNPLSKINYVTMPMLQIANGTSNFVLVLGGLGVDYTVRKRFDQINDNGVDLCVSLFKTFVTGDESHFHSGLVSIVFRQASYCFPKPDPGKEAFWINRTCRVLCTNDALQCVTAHSITKSNRPSPLEEEQNASEIQSPSIIQAKPQPPENIGLTYTIEKDHETYLVIRNRDGYSSETAGKLPSLEEAQNWKTVCENEIRQVNAHNQMTYQKFLEGYELGVPLASLGIHYIKPLYLTIDAPGYTARLNIGGEKGPRAENKKHPERSRQEILTQAKNRVNANLNDGKAQLHRLETAIETQAPPHITPPQGVHEVPGVKYGNEHIYILGIDEFGQATTIGKFKDPDDARLVAIGKARLEANIFALESQCFQARVLLAESGVPIEEIPREPTFERPQITGKTYEEIQPQMRASEIRNQQATDNYIAQLSVNFEQPLTPK